MASTSTELVIASVEEGLIESKTKKPPTRIPRPKTKSIKRKIVNAKQPTTKRQKKMSIDEKKTQLINSRLRVPDDEVLTESLKTKIEAVEKLCTSEKKTDVALQVAKQLELGLFAKQFGRNVVNIIGKSLDFASKSNVFSQRFQSDSELHENLGRIFAEYAPKYFTPQVALALRSTEHIVGGVSELRERKLKASSTPTPAPPVKTSEGDTSNGMKGPGF